jgi:F0F1-type ATP synthase delta subunit
VAFTPERWAEAFVSVLDRSGGDVEEGLEALRAMAPVVSGISVISGYASAFRLRGILRSVLDAGKYGGGAEAAAGIVLLLTERKALKRIFSVIDAVEKQVDRRKNIVEAVLETASPAGGDFTETLKAHIREGTGAGEVRLKILRNQELLGGYRLRLGSRYIDASLRGLLRGMTADLAYGVPAADNAAIGGQ